MKIIEITKRVAVHEHEIQWEAVRSQGPGGQNVNKVASAVHLRFDIGASGLPEDVKAGLIRLRDRRISKQGVVVIKAQRFRSREKNRIDAVDRLKILIEKAMQKPVVRKPTKPSRRAAGRRMDKKTRRGQIKKLRGRVTDNSL